MQRIFSGPNDTVKHRGKISNPVSGKQITPLTLSRYQQRGKQLLNQFAALHGVDINASFEI